VKLSSTCNTLQQTATRCNTLQHPATHCNTMQHTATPYSPLQHTARNLCHGKTERQAQPVPPEYKFSKVSVIAILYGRLSSELAFENDDDLCAHSVHPSAQQ